MEKRRASVLVRLSIDCVDTQRQMILLDDNNGRRLFKEPLTDDNPANSFSRSLSRLSVGSLSNRQFSIRETITSNR